MPAEDLNSKIAEQEASIAAAEKDLDGLQASSILHGSKSSGAVRSRYSATGGGRASEKHAEGIRGSKDCKSSLGTTMAVHRTSSCLGHVRRPADSLMNQPCFQGKQVARDQGFWPWSHETCQGHFHILPFYKNWLAIELMRAESRVCMA